jgi:hypothetical protein
LDVSNNLASELNLAANSNLFHLDARNNSLIKINIDSPQFAYLDVSKNYLKELDLRIVTNLQTLNCSDNLNLANLILPNRSNPQVLDCRNTSLEKIIFSNSSIFNCETGKLVLANTTSTTTSIPTTITTVPTASTTTIVNDGLSISDKIAIGSSVAGVFLAVIVTVITL